MPLLDLLYCLCYYYDMLFKPSTAKLIKPISFSEIIPGSAAERVVRTVERLKLDPEQTVLVGSAGLVMYGIGLSSIATTDYQEFTARRPRPGDVDFTSTGGYFRDLAESCVTPGNDPLRIKEVFGGQQVILRAKLGGGMLPADIMTRFDPDKIPIKRFDKKFRRYYEGNSHPVLGAPVEFRVATLEHIINELRRQRYVFGLYPEKEANDLSAIQNFLSER
jgi:hypothetical protein